MNILLAIAFAVSVALNGQPVQPMQNVVTIENEALTGLSLPPFGTLCQDTPVLGGPDADIYQPIYTLKAGETVALREQPVFEHRDWVMIAPAEWIPLSALCE